MGKILNKEKWQVEKHLKRMTRFPFAKSGSNVKQKVHYINLFKVSWTHNPTATENTELQLVLWGSAESFPVSYSSTF